MLLTLWRLDNIISMGVRRCGGIFRGIGIFGGAYGMAETCARCGVKLGFLTSSTIDNDTGLLHCYDCAVAIEAEKRKQREQVRQQVSQAAKKVLVTTTPKVDGYYVEKYIGIESVEFVIGTGAFSEISSSLADFFGTRSSAFEKKLQEAKRHAMAALKYVAAEQGANAVIGIDLDYTEFSGNRVALVINGTLVKLAPIRPVPSEPG